MKSLHDDKQWNNWVRQGRFQQAIGEEVTRRLMNMRVNYLLRYGSDPYTMFKLYVDITRGIKI